MWRRSTLPREQVWDEELASGQDSDFNLKALLGGSKGAVFTEPRFFVRNGLKLRERVTMGFETPRRVTDGERFVTSIWTRLKAKNQLTAGRVLLLARRHLMLAEQWRGLGQPERAFRIWALALERGLINRRFFREGQWLLRMWAFPPIRRVFRLWLALTWPAEMQLKYQPPTKGFTPAEPGKRQTAANHERSAAIPPKLLLKQPGS